MHYLPNRANDVDKLYTKIVEQVWSWKNNNNNCDISIALVSLQIQA